MLFDDAKQQFEVKLERTHFEHHMQKKRKLLDIVNSQLRFFPVGKIQYLFSLRFSFTVSMFVEIKFC